MANRPEINKRGPPSIGYKRVPVTHLSTIITSPRVQKVLFFYIYTVTPSLDKPIAKSDGQVGLQMSNLFVL